MATQLRIGAYYRLKASDKYEGLPIIRIGYIGIEVPIRFVQGTIIKTDNSIIQTRGLDDSSDLSLRVEDVYEGEINREALERIRLNRLEKLSNAADIAQVNDFFGAM